MLIKTQIQMSGSMSETRTPGGKIELENRLDQILDKIEKMSTLQKDTQTTLNKLEIELCEIKKVTGKFGIIENTLKKIRDSLGKANNKVETVENKVEVYQHQVEELTDKLAILEMKQKETYIRIRGLKELQNEDLKERLLPLLAEIWELSEEEAITEINFI
uniref:Uncharacterized protein n=1 Tax=Sphaerodactylus townsendi TaxID=933632 RepID=A0ACB8G4R3_9SAUR